MPEQLKGDQPSTEDVDPITSPAPGPVASESLSNLLGYEIIDVLGRGGMGIVYKARQTRLRRLVALKMITATDQPNPRQLARFRTEAEAVARLQHPNIIQIYDVGEVEGHPFYSMEYMEGGSLGKRFRGGLQSPRQAAQVVRVLAEAVHYAHQNSIIHRDLKPGNILLTRAPCSRSSDDSHSHPTLGNGSSSSSPTSLTGDIADVSNWTLKISDFGLAKQLGEESGQTRTGDLLGTPSYMAPEQIPGGGRNTGPPTDIYALGALLYWALTGRPPFRGDNPLETLDLVRSQEPTPPSQLQHRIPIDLEIICLKCLQKEASKRYPTAQALAEDLGRFLAGEPIRARPIGPLARTWSWCRRNPRLATWIALAWIFLVGGSAASIYFGIEAQRKADLAQKSERLAERKSYCLGMMQAYADYEKGQIKQVRARLRSLESDQRSARGFESYYLERLCRLDLCTIPHPGHVTALAFEPLRGRWLATADTQGVHLWETATGKELRSFPGHHEPVRDLAVSANGRLLASGGNDNSVTCWDTDSWRDIQRFPHPGTVVGVAFSPDCQRLASACRDGQVRVWDVVSGKLQHYMAGHVGFVRGVAFSPVQNVLVSTGYDGTIRVWDPESGKPLHEPISTGRPLHGVAFNPDGSKVAVASSDHTVSIWDAKTWRRAEVLRGHAAEVLSVSFSNDGVRVVSASFDNSVRTWDVASGAPLLEFHGHEATGVWMARFSPDGRLIASAGDDDTVKLWDSANDQRFMTLLGHKAYGTSQLQCPSPVKCLRYSPNGQRLASAGEDCTVRVWRAADGQEERVLSGHAGCVRSLAFAGEDQLASGGDDQAVRLWDLSTGRCVKEWRNHTDSVEAVTASQDGGRIASGGDDGRIVIYDQRADAVRNLADRQGIIQALAFDANGERLASGGIGGLLKIWNLKSGSCKEVPNAHVDICSLAFSNDGRRLVSGGSDNLIKVWDADAGVLCQTLRGHTCNVSSVQFTDDGTRVVSASGCDGSLRIWDALTGESILIFRDTPICNCVVGPGSQQLAGAMADGSVRIWDARPLTREIEIDRCARYMAESVLRNDPEEEHAVAKISADATITDEVRQKALELAKSSATAYLDRAAVAVIDPLFAKPLFRDEVIEALNNDQRLTDRVRKHALALAVDYPENVEGLATDCQIAVAVPGRSSKRYERALKEAEIICRSQDRPLEHWSLLAMAQYRMGQYAQALSTFQNHSELSSPHPYQQVRELAFMAMAQHGLGRTEEARQTLARAQEIMKKPFINGRVLVESFLREAEDVLRSASARH